MSGTERYAYSQLTDTWYLLHDWEDLGDGQIRAKSKEPVGREEVPQQWIDGVNERIRETDTDRSEGEQ